MKAWIVVGTGAPGAVMQCVERESPRPGPGMLRVRVLVAGLGLPEVLMCRGVYPYQPALPFTPGHEAVGIVLEAGPHTRFVPGQRVMGISNFIEGHGGHAEEALLIDGAATPVPDGMADEQAAVFTIGAQTAYVGLVIRGGLRSGETLLVLGAAGGTGLPAVQLGKALGARVIAVVRGADKAAQCRRDGADHVVDSAACADGDWVAAVRAAAGAGGVDVVFDPVGGEPSRRALDCMGYGARLVAIGFASGAWGEIPTWELVNRNLSLVGAIAMVPDDASRNRMVEELFRLHAAGSLTPLVSRVHAFGAIPAALEALEQRRVIGRHVVRIAESTS